MIAKATVTTMNPIVVEMDAMEETEETDAMDVTEETEEMARMRVVRGINTFMVLPDHEVGMGIPEVLDRPVLKEIKETPEKWDLPVLKASKAKPATRERREILAKRVLPDHKASKAIKETRGIPEKWVQLVLKASKEKRVQLVPPVISPKHLSMLIPLHHKTFQPNNPLSMMQLQQW